ncbi:MAG: helix-turn-helix domain-containing protein, partial [Burkholderiaceae bacterium]|nr:helix-turn-helix domain-containing protein [Burkholderiaceae bacterium]
MSEPIQTVEQLVAAREARGLSVADVSQQLKLAPRQINAIEQGDWEALPGPAFTRAVLRGYGRLLGGDVEALVAGVSGAVTPSDLRPAASLDEPIRARGVFGFGSGGSGSSFAWVGLVVLGLVALALFFGGEGGLSNLRSWIGSPGESSTVARPDAQGSIPAQANGAPSAGTTTTTPIPLGQSPAATSADAPGRGQSSVLAPATPRASSDTRSADAPAAGAG